MSRAGKLLKSLNEFCPVKDLLYGGVPEVGGYNSFTEYEIGAQRIAEAIHCILGSLGKSMNSPAWVEKDHVEEEIGLVVKFQKEYRKSLYVGRLFNDRKDNPYVRKSVESIRKNSPKLISLAKQYRRQLSKDMPEVVREVAEACYTLLIRLAEAMLKSVKGFPEKDVTNGIDDSGVGTWVGVLKMKVDKYLALPDETVIGW